MTDTLRPTPRAQSAVGPLRVPSSPARLAALQRVRTRRRMRRNVGFLVMMLVILTAGFALTLTFFVGSMSVVRGLHDFFDSHYQQAGSFVLDPSAEPPDAEGVVAHVTADLDVLDSSRLRIFTPRTQLDRHTVVEGRDLQESGEILNNRSFGEEHDLPVGATIDAGDRTWQIVGYLTTPDYVSVKSNQLVLQPNHAAFGIAMVSAEDFRSDFDDRAYRTYAYDSRYTAADLIDRYDPLDLRQTIDDSRVQIALTDADGPRDLAFLVFLLFLAIAGALLAVYHLRIRSQDELNNVVLRQAGLDRGLRRHQGTETRLLLALCWTLSYLAPVLMVRPMMGINGELYDYPDIPVMWVFLALCALGGLLVCLALDDLTYRMANRGRGAGRRGGAPPRWIGIRLEHLRFLPDFGHRYKLTRAVRRPGETVAITALVLIVGLFTTFSLNLKWSVEAWVDSLAETTPYDRLYDLSGQTEPISARPGQEEAAVATVYAHDATQSVFRVPPDSRFVGGVDGLVVTRAFADKYGATVGSEVGLTDVSGQERSTARVSAIREEDTASAFLYVPEGGWEELVPTGTRFAPLLMSDSPDDRLEDRAPTIARVDVQNSGENIIRVINAQVSLLVILAAALLVVLFTAITAFTRSTQEQATRILSQEGFTPTPIRRSLFGGITVLALLGVAAAGALAGVVVRVFLDGIMGRFVNFVPVTATWSATAVALVGVVVLMQVCIALSGRRRAR